MTFVALNDLDLSDETVWSEEDLVALSWAAHDERLRRERLRRTEAEIGETIRAHQQATGRKDGDPYMPPTGYLDAYPKDSIVTHGGREWEATRDGATGVPGESPDWREIAPERIILEWVQPHAGSEYPVGAIVSHNGHLWENGYERNGWEPGTPHSQWTDLGPVT